MGEIKTPYVTRSEMGEIIRVVQATLAGMDTALEEVLDAVNQHSEEFENRRSVTEAASAAIAKLEENSKRIADLEKRMAEINENHKTVFQRFFTRQVIIIIALTKSIFLGLVWFLFTFFRG